MGSQSSEENVNGRQGLRKCQSCRQLHRRCVYDHPETRCDLCISRGQPCGVKVTPSQRLERLKETSDLGPQFIFSPPPSSDSVPTLNALVEDLSRLLLLNVSLWRLVLRNLCHSKEAKQFLLRMIEEIEPPSVSNSRTPQNAPSALELATIWSPSPTYVRFTPSLNGSESLTSLYSSTVEVSPKERGSRIMTPSSSSMALG